MMKTDADRAGDARRLAQLSDSLTNWTPNSDAIANIESLRAFARDYGERLIQMCPDSRERSIALTHLEDSVMWAVKSLVLPER